MEAMPEQAAQLAGERDPLLRARIIGGASPPYSRAGAARIGPYGRNASACENLLFDKQALPSLFETLIANAGFGVILASPKCEIIYANKLACSLIRLQRGLCSQRGRIGATDVATNQKLQSLIFAAAAYGNQAISERSIILPVKDSEEIFALHVVPVARKAPERNVFQGRLTGSPDIAALFISNRTRDAAGRANVFAPLFGLTAGETRLLEAIILARSLAAAARRLKITPSTARTHLKHIMAKTNTHRQAELTQLFLEMTSPFAGWGMSITHS